MGGGWRRRKLTDDGDFDLAFENNMTDEIDEIGRNVGSDNLSITCVRSFAKMVVSFFRVRPFRAFVSVSVVDEAQRTFTGNYRPLIVDILLSESSTLAPYRAFVNTALVVVGDVWKFVAVNLADFVGVVNVVRTAFFCKFVFPLFVAIATLASRQIWSSVSLNSFATTTSMLPDVSNNDDEGTVSFSLVVAAILVMLVTELTLQSGPGAFFSLFMTRLSPSVRDELSNSFSPSSSSGANVAFPRPLASSKKVKGDSETIGGENRKRTKISFLALMWSTHALIAKPLNSIGPVLGAYVLVRSDLSANEKRARAIALVFLVPILVGVFQACCFRAYRLKHC